MPAPRHKSTYRWARRRRAKAIGRDWKDLARGKVRRTGISRGSVFVDVPQR